jgi:NAD(P)-dependent dehydrogenase (short-subunit alcohol dehydrogenase family)
MAPSKLDNIPYRANIYPEIDPTQSSAGAFKDKVVLVTGSGRGIGRELGLSFAGFGAKVCFTDLELKDAQLVADEATLRTGSPALAVGADVRVYSDLERLYDETIERLGQVDILINNAGYGDFLPFDIARPEEYWDIMTLNLKAPMDLTRLVLPSMIQRNTGTIICITTTGAMDNYPFCIPYMIAKTGQAKLVHCLHLELKDKNIRAFHVHPGTPATKMGDPSYAMKPYVQEATSVEGVGIWVSAILEGRHRIGCVDHGVFGSWKGRSIKMLNRFNRLTPWVGDISMPIMIWGRYSNVLIRLKKIICIPSKPIISTRLRKIGRRRIFILRTNIDSD